MANLELKHVWHKAFVHNGQLIDNSETPWHVHINGRLDNRYATVEEARDRIDHIDNWSTLGVQNV